VQRFPVGTEPLEDLLALIAAHLPEARRLRI
jgi:hypothetical protein